ncbi:MAG TPA: serine hydrolase [Kineosporiaceae bacterium]|nr:serine hydrolase [Kineosporiaceae bacterium]
MFSPRPARVLAALTAGFVLAVAAPTESATAAIDAVAAAKPKPVPLPAASSWVGGKELIGTSVLTDLPAGVPKPKSPAAASWLIADLDTRSVLAGRRVHVPLAPASTLKIFTALALAPKLDPDKVYTGRDADAAIDGTKVGIDPGSTYTVNDLLHGMMMSSGNDCANALGTLVGGTSKATTLMQEQAVALGAFDTVPHNTSGLDAKGQVSSAYDLALAGSAALENKQLAKIMKTTAYKFPGIGKSLGKKRKRFETQNHNRLLRNYTGSIGVKNGYTVAARGSFVGAATRKGHTYLVVVMRSEGSTWHQAADLLDWAFAHGKRARPVGTLVQPGELTAKTGPAVGDDGLSLGAGTPAATAPAAADDSLRGALPAAQASLTKPATDNWTGKLLLAAAALALIALALVAGRRPLFGGRGARSSTSNPHSRLPGSGRHHL